MPWLLSESRGPQWKQGWRTHTLNSLSLPPAHLLAVFAIVLFFLLLSPSRRSYRERAERTEVGFQLLLLLLPLMLFFTVKWMVVDGRRQVLSRALGCDQDGMSRTGGSSPWVMVALVVLLLVMISLHSSIESQWFRPLWRRL